MSVLLRVRVKSVMSGVAEKVLSGMVKALPLVLPLLPNAILVVVATMMLPLVRAIGVLLF